ncbi:MAG: copper chaperone PCu(A)C [Alphaproteobacteria bacterium]|nr:copper chaperone PCu(A)C [Alphaproteobacteria bacterium]
MVSRRLSLVFLAAALAVSDSAPGLAQDYKLGTLEISQPWTRATPATAQSAGGFLTVTNKGTTPDRLIAAQSSVSAKVEVHEMRMDGNVMKMRELEKGLEIAPGATVMLKPGSYHIMFMGLKAPIAKDSMVPVTLVFEKAGSIEVELKAAAIGAAAATH